MCLSVQNARSRSPEAAGLERSRAVRSRWGPGRSGPPTCSSRPSMAALDQPVVQIDAEQRERPAPPRRPRSRRPGPPCPRAGRRRSPAIGRPAPPPDSAGRARFGQQQEHQPHGEHAQSHARPRVAPTGADRTTPDRGRPIGPLAYWGGPCRRSDSPADQGRNVPSASSAPTPTAQVDAGDDHRHQGQVAGPELPGKAHRRQTKNISTASRRQLMPGSIDQSTLAADHAR